MVGSRNTLTGLTGKPISFESFKVNIYLEEEKYKMTPKVGF